ncbi:hypothetical protein EDC04DRAFT_712411 [Pisolithus marmoratus]|nr:hypothetical protein EDC04DRAFT_712411 [Pisolithus marmoratus]
MSRLWLSDVPRHLVTFFHQWMSQPSRGPIDVGGLFNLGHSQVNARTWHSLLLRRWEKASSCKLKRIEFYRGGRNNWREFLVLHFSHHVQQSAGATVIIERTTIGGYQVSSSVPGCPTTEVVDYVHVLGQKEDLKTWLAKTYDKYEILRALEYAPSGSSQPPSVIQLSNLVFVAHQYCWDSHPYVHDCCCFLHTMFEASKELFSGGKEHRYRHPAGGRSSLKIETLDLHDLHSVCQIYERSWEELVRRRTERAEIMRKLEKANRKLQEVRRAREEEGRAREEAVKNLEEGRRHFQEVCNAHAARVQDLQQALEDCREARGSSLTSNGRDTTS